MRSTGKDIANKKSLIGRVLIEEVLVREVDN